MSDIRWRRVRPGEYESEAGRVTKGHELSADVWKWSAEASPRTWGFTGNAADAKAACERAYLEAQS